MTQLETTQPGGPVEQRGGRGERGQRGERGHRGERGDRGDRGERNESGFDENVVQISRCAKVVKGGRRFSFGALVIVGDRKGKVGVGYAKSPEVPSAVEKAKRGATQAMLPIKLVGGTIPHRVIGRFGASQVVLVPASPGTGVIAGASVRAVLELAGVQNILTKSYGSNSPKNLVRATMAGLRSMMSREEIERLRGVSLAS
jgi:small subunit ribosomal protein S5